MPLAHPESFIFAPMRKLMTTAILFGMAFSLFYCSPKNSEEQVQTNVYPIEDSLQVMTTFPAEVDESSGLFYASNGIWTHNDSGGGAELYNVNTTAPEVLSRRIILNAGARDWEEMADDSTYLYIGDFGNNKGKRRDLTIYKLPHHLLQSDTTSITAEKIIFHYPDQERFDAGAYNHNFDCEAMIAVGDSLYLFSKNHENERCRLYSLPNSAGKYEAQLKSEFDTDGLITAADYDPQSGVLALLGYNVYKKVGKWQNKPFVWLIDSIPGNDFFSGNAVRVNLGFEQQTEGICFGEDGQLIISCEGEGNGFGALYSFHYIKWLK
ncbi:MAG: hypothetical protein DWQ02_07280 [Bacteroidetes bacterium]|nr:MAG: hypothetical protein DWQ02_07280 [Bacteroidota bacterium]